MKKQSLRDLYKKEQKRIRQFLNRAEKRGYLITDKQALIPELPKRVTKKALEKIREIKPISLYKKIEYVSRETGEIISGLRGRDIERSLSAQKAARTRFLKKEYPELDISPEMIEELQKNMVDETDYILEEFLNDARTLDNYSKRKPKFSVYETIKQWLDNQISKSGKKQVAIRLKQAKESGIAFEPYESYDLTQLVSKLAKFADFIKIPIKEVEKIYEAMQENENYEEY